MQKQNVPHIINIGWGDDISIKDLSQLIAEKAGFKGEFVWDTSKPDGMPRKCLDVSNIKALGFQPKIDLSQGIEKAIHEYKALKKGQQ
jgi:GDP-L-fucose synthase